MSPLDGREQVEKRWGGGEGPTRGSTSFGDWEEGDGKSSHPKVLVPLNLRNPDREVCFETEDRSVCFKTGDWAGWLWGPRR